MLNSLDTWRMTGRRSEKFACQPSEPHHHSSDKSWPFAAPLTGHRTK
jgi:hypothetical protein